MPATEHCPPLYYCFSFAVEKKCLMIDDVYTANKATFLVPGTDTYTHIHNEIMNQEWSRKRDDCGFRLHVWLTDLMYLLKASTTAPGSQAFGFLVRSDLWFVWGQSGSTSLLRGRFPKQVRQFLKWSWGLWLELHKFTLRLSLIFVVTKKHFWFGADLWLH